jgi:hypothetical protein
MAALPLSALSGRELLALDGRIFDFCGGLLFALRLSAALRAQLSAADKARSIAVAGAAVERMSLLPGYRRSNEADNAVLFHGREVRDVPGAAGGQGLVLHLVLAGAEDAEGWSKQELLEYDGWGHDSRRKWRKADSHAREGFPQFKSLFGAAAYSLHHRFYFHLDGANQLWLSAEDGCEGRLLRPA